MAEDFRGATVLNAASLGVVAISNEINHVKGSTATKLVKPGRKTTLVLHVESGNFRFKLGDYDGTPNAAIAYTSPTVTVDDGSGTGKLVYGDRLAFAAPSELTVVGDSPTAVLTYWWM